MKGSQRGEGDDDNDDGARGGGALTVDQLSEGRRGRDKTIIREGPGPSLGGGRGGQIKNQAPRE